MRSATFAERVYTSFAKMKWQGMSGWDYGLRATGVETAVRPVPLVMYPSP